MLQSLKKNAKKSEGDASLAWHPNFRNTEALPDTKTVRTKFFVNIIVIAVTLALLLSGALREFKLSSLRTELADLEEQVSASTKASNDAIAAYKLFQAQEKLFAEAHGFVKDPFRFPDFIIRLGQILPPGVTIRRIEYKSLTAGLVVSASVVGLDAGASDEVAAFVQLVKSDTVLARDFPVVSLTGLPSRNMADNSMSFEMAFAPKPVAKPAPKGGAGK